MSKGIDFDFRRRVIARYRLLKPGPPFNQSGQIIYGTFPDKGYSPPIVAFMHDFYSVSAEEQRQMALNTIALCELKYNQQEIDHV
jgi:hypothetical protein